jgi:peptidoglycan/xylan/chitin deacetylase (PgdA/CDA1 family)
MFYAKFILSKVVSEIIGGFFKKNGTRILMYHSIKKVENNKNIYSISRDSFYLQMKTLLGMSSINVIPLESMTGSSNEVVITFDDGYSDTYRIAAPILKKLKIPFTVFITPKFIENNNPDYLNKNELILLSKTNGCSIGAHGYTHCKLTYCNNRQLKYELLQSKRWLEDVLESKINSMSYPYGDCNEIVRNKVKDAGYRYSATSNIGANPDTQDMLLLNRTDIWSLDSPKTFIQKVRGKWDWIDFFVK